MERDNNWINGHIKSWFKPHNYRQVLLFIITYLIVVFFITIAHLTPDISHFQIGKISKKTIRTEYTFLYTDKFEMDKLIHTIESGKPQYYNYVEDHYKIFEDNLKSLSNMMLEDSPTLAADLKNKEIQFTSDIYNYFVKNGKFISKYLIRLNYLYRTITSIYTVIDELGPESEIDYYEIVKKTGNDKVPIDKTLVFPLDKKLVLLYINKIYPGMETMLKETLAEIFINIIRPEAKRNGALRDEMINQEALKLKENRIMNSGEFLIHRGEIITGDNYTKILAYTEYKKNDLKTKIWIYYFLSLFLFLFLIYRFYKYERETFLKKYNLYIALLGFLFVNGIYYSTYIYYEIPFIPYFLVIPFAIVSITLPVLLNNTKVSIILMISYSFFLLFYPSFDIITYLNLIIISFSTIYTSQILKKRNDFFIIALLIGIIECVFSIIYFLYNRTRLNQGQLGISQMGISEWSIVVLFSFGNGLISAIISSGIMPLLENIFNIPTRFRLIELTNPTTSPLLKKLKIEAPGTYNHSLLLGDMCEAAAEKLGIDSLLVKAGGYYHDIGKIEIPQYFIENQEGDNRHDEIKVSMSVSVIKSHVKMGIELAKKYRLPDELQDYIKEHHGTTAISYFYHQALGLFGDENVNIEDYEYQGPKPHTKGTAILMLADGVEASVRAYSQNNERFTTNIIEDIIEDIINKRMEKGQFDNCDITLHDLKIVAEEFFKFLAGFYHKRIEYAKK